MEPLDALDSENATSTIVAENLARMREFFPEAWTEGRIDFDVLKQLLGEHFEDAPERYGLNWRGKRQARELGLAPADGTLQPRPEESVDWDTTQNLVIEGNNLDVLKLLQKPYAGRVKMIYIDPPYNTGNDFVYRDDFRDGIRSYLELTGQRNGGARQTSREDERTGRFHSAWLNMMYPRLRLARNLLRRDGVMFVSIDDVEVASLRQICAEIFGEENFLAMFVRRRRMATGMRGNPISPDHEYVVAYARNAADVRLFGTARKESDFPFIDAKGRYRSTDLTVGMTKTMRPNQYFAIASPHTGVEYWPPNERVWRFEPTTMKGHVNGDNIIWPDDPESGRKMTRPRFKTRWDPSSDNPRTNPVSTWIDAKKRSRDEEEDADDGADDVITLEAGLNQEATKEVRELFGEQVFEYPKPVSFVRALCAIASSGDDIVLDFFAGSGTTGHAVLSLNQLDGGHRRFILVQMAEQTDREDYPTIPHITRERLRRAGRRLRDEVRDHSSDVGFRSFAIAESVLLPWRGGDAVLEQQLLDSIDHVAPGASDLDLVFELLVRRGIDLSARVDTTVIAGKHVYAIDAGAVLMCSATSIRREETESLAVGLVEWHHTLAPQQDPLCVFRDSAFADDVAKANLAAILEQHGIKNIRSL